MWWPNGASTSKPIQGLTPGTYYWQVKTATTGTDANTGTWWTFTVGAQVTSFSKTTPPNGGVLTANVAPLSWTAADGAQFYEVCVDAIDNGDCDTAWVSNAVSPHRLFGGLTDGTYYWQVRVTTAEGQAWANDGAWWTIHVDAPNPIREYIYLGGKLLASLSFTPTTSVLTYYHTDALGSVRAITDASGNPLVRHDYAAFGEGTPLQGDPRRFLGQERDFESGLDHFGAREYRNIWGRFTSPDDSVFSDPLDPQTFNLYAYVLNNPLRWVDPTGHAPQDPQSPPSSQAPDFRLTTWGCVFACGWDDERAEAHSWEEVMGFWGRSSTMGALRNIASIGVGAIPVVGSVQSVVELISGRDYITGESVGRLGAGIGIVAGIIPGGKGALKAGTKAFGLRLIHSAETITTGVAKHSYDFWRTRSTAEIIESLKAGAKEPLTVGREGAVMQGNTRIHILMERGVDVSLLPRVPHK